MSGKLNLRCPGCKAELVVDASTGAILHHREHRGPPAGGKSFEDLLEDLDQRKERAEQLFGQSQAEHDDRERLLEERFREAMKRAEDEPDEEPPRRPFDFD